MRKLTKNDVTVKVYCLEEECSIRGNALDSGDDAVDRECEDSIREDLNSGNEWAWCTVKVVVCWKDFYGSDFLGCCSYDSEEDFKHGGYYDDMVDNALDDLNGIIERTYAALEELGE